MKTPHFLLSTLALFALSASSQAEIVAAEYYINGDPGPGNGSPVADVVSATLASIHNDVPAATIAALPSGTHLLTARVQNAAGDWSVAFTRPFLKEDPASPTQATIIAAEYYIDVDPGPGNGTPAATAPGQNAVSFQIDVPPAVTAALSLGTHWITGRVKNSAGQWSVAFTRPFLKDNPVAEPVPLATHIVYQWHLNGVPQGAPVTLMPQAPAEQISFDFLTSLQGLVDGTTYQFVATPYDSAGNRGFSQTKLVKIETTDTDGDGLPDLWELANQLNPDDLNDANLDSDSDGLSSLMEFLAKTDPRNPDTSGDGISDKFAIDLGLNPLVANPQFRTAILANSGELGLASESQIRALSPSTPILARNAATGNFTLRLGLSESANLSEWTKLPLIATDSVITDGELEFSFRSDTDTMFYRVSAAE
jgi:hypothetical protein